jgi:hypothetical protein
MEALAFFDAPAEHVDELGDVVFRASRIRQSEACLDYIVDVTKSDGISLRSVVVREIVLVRGLPADGRCARRGGLRSHFIPSKACKQNGRENFDSLDVPRDGGLPKDRFE